jgi:hypothetical protein
MKRCGLGKFNDAISIRDRSAEVEDRVVLGLIVGRAYEICPRGGGGFDRKVWQQLFCDIGRAEHMFRDAGKG